MEAALLGGLDRTQPLYCNFRSPPSNFRKIIVRLHLKPSRGAAANSGFQAHRHLGRDRAVPVDDAVKLLSAPHEAGIPPPESCRQHGAAFLNAASEVETSAGRVSTSFMESVGFAWPERAESKDSDIKGFAT